MQYERNRLVYCSSSISTFKVISKKLSTQTNTNWLFNHNNYIHCILFLTSRSIRNSNTNYIHNRIFSYYFLTFRLGAVGLTLIWIIIYKHNGDMRYCKQWLYLNAWSPDLQAIKRAIFCLLSTLLQALFPLVTSKKKSQEAKPWPVLLI